MWYARLDVPDFNDIASLIAEADTSSLARGE
jgi:hypothetical protein